MAMHQTSMVQCRHLVLLLCCSLMMSETPPMLEAADRPTSSGRAGSDTAVPLVSILQEQAIIHSDNVTFEGRIVHANDLLRLEWSIIDVNGQRGNGSLMQSLEVMESGDFQTDKWSLPFEPAAFSPCSCLLIIVAYDAVGGVGRATLTLFAGDASTLAPTVTISTDGQKHLANQSLAVGVVHAAPAGNGSLEWVASTGAAHSDGCGVNGVTEIYPDTGWVSQPSSDLTDGVLTLDTTAWPDGWAMLHMRATDADGKMSWVACTVLGIDAGPPVVVLQGASMLLESDDVSVFDGSASIDPFWGREDLVHVWKIERLDQGGGPSTVMPGSTEDSLSLQLNESGLYRIKLTVTDSVGQSNSTSLEASIANIQPLAGFNIDGIVAIDGQTVRLADAEEWNIDASSSTDSSNDMDGLEYLWLLDDSPLMNGMIRSLQRPAADSIQHRLSLVVSDDDGASDNITVTFGIAGSGSDPDRSPDRLLIPLLAFSLLLIGGIGCVVWITGWRPRREAIQKWQENRHAGDD